VIPAFRKLFFSRESRIGLKLIADIPVAEIGVSSDIARSTLSRILKAAASPPPEPAMRPLGPLSSLAPEISLS
jgi:hypothetical protein